MAPAIIFIDELDAIGREARRRPGGAADDEREQTLNQILTEMDGFSGSEGVIVIAATNRPNPRPALLRPGRFDRRVTVSPPDRPDASASSGPHTQRAPRPRGRPLPVGLAHPGHGGSRPEEPRQRGGLAPARRRAVTPATDFDRGARAVLLGAERRIAVSALERARDRLSRGRARAVGHARARRRPGQQVSIVPRGQSLGVDLPGRGAGPLRLRHRLPARAASSSRWAGVPPRISSTAT